MAASIDSLKLDSLEVKEELLDEDYINHQVSVLMSDEELTPGSSAAEGVNEECEEEDDKLQGWINESSNNYNTKRHTKYALSLFEEFSKRENVNFEDIDNKALDVLLSNFYKAARNKKGDLYALKSMRGIRCGLQRYFLESLGIDIIRSDEFSLSHKTFGAVSRKLKRFGKDKVRHHPKITVDDMARMQASLDLSTTQGLQHKVFLDTVLYFGRSGMRNLHTTRPGDFVLHQENNQLFYTFQENREAQMCAMPGNPRCPVANLKRYISKLNSNCEWMWQRPRQRFSDSEDPCIWYENSPLGKDNLSFMTRTISELAGCNKGYTIQSLRKSMTEKMLETLSRNDSTGQNRDYAITVVTLPSSTSNSVVTQINKIITASPRVPVAAPITDSSMNIIKPPSMTASSSNKATHLQTMQQNTSVTSKSNTGVNEGTMTELTWIELPRKLVQSKDASTQWEKQPPTHSTQAASTSSTQDLDEPSCGDDGELEQDGLGWCSEDTPAVQEDEFMDSSEPSDGHIDGSTIVAWSIGDVKETTVAESQERERSNTPILRRIKEEMIDELEEGDYQTLYVKEEYLEDHCQDDDYAHVQLTSGGHLRFEAESPRSTQQTNSDRAPRQNGGPCIRSKEAEMAEATIPRVELLDDDQLQDSIDSECSKNTKSFVKFSVRIFEDYLKVINTDLDSVNKLPNSELDKVLQRFYAGARRKNGSPYTKKTMLCIRYGLQRYFLISKNVDIGKHEDFTNSKSVFKQFFLLKGQEMESHREQISSLQMEVQRLREDLRQEKADKAALKDEVIRLKLYIVDHCLKEKRGQSHRTNDTPFLEVGSFETEEDTSKDLPALPQPPPSVPTRATPQTSKTKASPSSSQEAVPQTPPSAPTPATPQTSKTKASPSSSQEAVPQTPPSAPTPATPQTSKTKASPSSSQEAVPQTPPSAPTPATPQTSKTKASPSNQEDQETKLLVNDPSDPNRYAHIRVSRVGYRTMVHKASRAKDGAKKLMNDALDLVFSREQLAASSGMGLRKEKDAGATGPHPLDAVKIAAILDFTKSFSKSQGWELPMDKELRRIVTNKVTNARRK